MLPADMIRGSFSLLFICCLTTSFRPLEAKRKHRDAGRGHGCRRVSIPMCKTLGYQRTKFPNFNENSSQYEAGLEITQFLPLVKVKCSPHLRKFLCSVYAPRCDEGKVVKPSRTLCEMSRNGCESLMNKFGFRWPFECAKYTTHGSQMDKAVQTPGKCETVTLPACRSISYDYTKMPNAYGHKSQNEAGFKLNEFLPIIQFGCSSELREFLCSVYVPRCENGKVKKPSRSMCKRARKGCAPLMKRFGLRWRFKCKKYGKEDKKVGRNCQRIRVPMCRDIGYRFTQFPNRLGHETQEEAASEVHQFWPLIEINCAPELKEFLCGLYVPECRNGRVRRPSRQHCERSKAGCLPVLKQYNFSWPDKMDCNKLS
jgi:hypothetical protein